MTSPGDPRWCARLRSVAAPRDQTAVNRADFDPEYDPSLPIECEVCGSVMRYIAACKILCSNCGYRRDCSDP